jgi:hypothetical protein
MKKLLLLSLIALLSATAFSQKIKIEDDIVYVDGAAYLNWNAH